MNAIFLGPPGAGKGTQAERISAEHDLAHLATGNLLRTAARQRTPMGLEAKRFMDAGDLVPDETLFGIVQEQIDAIGDRGVIFDGFPRNIAQAERLTSMMDEVGRQIDAAVLFVLEEDEAVRRISGRRQCSTCGHTFHVEFAPPPPGPTCVRGTCEIIQRDDDREEVVRDRQRVFREQTEPLVAFYEERGLLRRIDAQRPADDVTEHILAVLLDPA